MASDLVLVVSGPSGAGKSTVVDALLRRGSVPGAFRVITRTTRQRREKERDGIDYIFVVEDEFRRAADRGEFLEWAYVHSGYYGSPREPVLEALRQDRLPILVVDVQGGLALKKRLPQSVLVFLAPPSRETLEARITEASDRRNDLGLRLANAEWEMRHTPYYDYVVTNDRVERAADDLEAVIRVERLRSHRRRAESLHP
jgi:guanylate kinase